MTYWEANCYKLLTLLLSCHTTRTRQGNTTYSGTATIIIDMQKIVIVLVILATIMMVEVAGQDSMLAPPDRPSEFRSPDELRRYLKALNEYYAIVGRPRFGRSVTKRSANDILFNTARKAE